MAHGLVVVGGVVPRSVFLVLSVLVVVVVNTIIAAVVVIAVVVVGLSLLGLVVGPDLHLAEVELEAGQLGELFEAQDVVLGVVEGRSPLLRLDAIAIVHFEVVGYFEAGGYFLQDFNQSPISLRIARSPEVNL